MANEKYQFKNFLQYKNLAHGISSKVFGSIKKNKSDIDREGLATFAKSIGVTGDIICMRQIHSGTVRIVQDTSDLRITQTDAMVTNNKNLPLAVLTADCLPLIFFDTKKNAIGVAHAGYKGLLNNVLENTILHFVSAFKSDPNDIIVGIGPSIEMDCYEVSEDRIEEFQKVFPKFENIYIKRAEKFFLDLRSVAQQCLVKEGILKENIEVIDICTKCDQEFYSYRRGDYEQRFVSLISLV
jgi:polyphenol oxidase